MKFRIERRAVIVTPESDQDCAFIEDTLGLRSGGDFVPLVRENAVGLGCIAYLTTNPMRKEQLRDVTAQPSPDSDDEWPLGPPSTFSAPLDAAIKGDLHGRPKRSGRLP